MSSGIVQTSQSSQQQKDQNDRGGSQESARLRLVQRLLASGDNLPAFLQDLLSTQAMVVAGTEAAAFMVEQGKEGIRLVPVVHMRPDQASDEVRKSAITAFTKLVTPCVEQNREGAFEVGNPDDAGELQYCLATILRSEGQPVGVTAVITRCRGMERARQRLASIELVAGYFEIYSMRRASEQARLVASSHQGVLQLMGSVATMEGFEPGCKNVCNELATRTGAARVALGWLKGKNIKVIALSHTDKFDKRQELLLATRKVMEECLDQEQVVHYDPAGGGTETVSREAQAYSRENGNCSVISVPLRRLNEVVGVIMLEFAADRKPDQNASTMVSLAGDVLTPQLYDRYENDRNIFVKVGSSIKKTSKEYLGEKHTLAKLIAVAALILFAVLVFYKPVYRVSAPFTITAEDRRAVASPTEGFVGQVGKIGDGEVRPGMRVKQGDVLLTLDTRDLVLQRGEALTRANALQKQADQKLHQEGKTAEAMIALEERKAELAKAELLTYRIERSSIRSPIDGEVLRGDWRDRVGAPVKEGDVLFEIAALESLEIEANVAERDIQLVKAQAKGEVATTSNPAISHPFTVTRIVPLGEPKEGSNVFKVYGKVDGEQIDYFKPGMVGEAKIETEPRRLIWVWTHRLTDWMRLKFWWW